MFQNDKSSFKTWRIMFQVQKVPLAVVGLRRQYLSVIILGQRIATSLGSGNTVDNSTSKQLRLLNLRTKVEYFVCFLPFHATSHVHMSLKEILSSFQSEFLAVGVEKLFLLFRFSVVQAFLPRIWIAGLKAFKGNLIDSKNYFDLPGRRSIFGKAFI